MYKYTAYLLVVGLLLKTPLFVWGELSSPAHRWYSEGLMYHTAGNEKLAQNSWRKYLAYCRLCRDECEMNRVQKAEELLKASKSVSALPVPISPPEVKPASPEKARPVVKSKLKTSPLKVDNEKLKKTERELALEAEQAKARGQLEHALNLYRLADKADPASGTYAKEIDELQKAIE